MSLKNPNYQLGAAPFLDRVSNIPLFNELLLKKAYAQAGTQLHIPRKAATHVEQVPLLKNEVFELYFEEPTLPTYVWASLDYKETCRFTSVLPPFQGFQIRFGFETPNGFCSTAFSEDKLAHYLHATDRLHTATGLALEDERHLALGLNHALKVLQSLRANPMIALTRRTYPWGGKPGVKHRPQRPAYLIS